MGNYFTKYVESRLLTAVTLKSLTTERLGQEMAEAAATRAVRHTNNFILEQ